MGYRLHRPVVGITFAMVALATASLSWAAVPNGEKATNPHWNKDGCRSCHTMQDGKPQPIPPDSTDEVCLNCHDGTKAAYEFHPVGRTFDAKRFIRPGKWPLVNDRLACITCHDLRPGCSTTAVRLVSNRMFLRDYRTGTNKSQPFCRNCHQESAYRKLNPHLMLLAEKDEIIEDKCLFCHEKPMDRKTLVRTGNPMLKTKQLDMCRDCHPQHKDPMQTNHVGLKLSKDMQALMYLREITGLNSNPGPPLVAQAKAAGAKPKLMVGAADETIVCSTCHNPHQAGVFPDESVLAYRTMRFGGQGKLVSPVRGQKWCRHCHDF